MSDSVHPIPTPDEATGAQALQSSEAAEPAAPPAAGSKDDWQTVDFPGALRVDQIPHAIPAPAAPSLVEGDRLTQLATDNTQLRAQIAQLEADLSQAQIDLQLEVARFYCKDPEAAPEPSTAAPSPDPALQAQIEQLTDDLERSHESSRRQELLIETLSRQLEGSQERIAQLERDCALSQQRYNEQVQLVSQVESNCRDLRMRLHRQQQQTLQFKIALEKSIEMAAASRMETVEPTTDDTQDFIPKAQPVQPWSNGNESSGAKIYAISRSAKGHLQNFFSHLLDTDPAAGPEPGRPTDENPAPPPALPSLQPSLELPNVDRGKVMSDRQQGEPASAATPENPSADLHQLFPSLAPQIPVAAVPPEAAVFDLSPFVEAGEMPAIAQPVPPQPATQDNPPTIKSAELQANIEGLWADLARLIEPELAASEAPSAPAPEVRETTPPRASEPTPAPTTPISLPTGAKAHQPDRLPVPAAIAVPNPFPSFNLREEGAVAQDHGTPPETDHQTAPESSRELVISTGWPAPVVYPFRPTKKIASMAAVDLPTFPRN